MSAKSKRSATLCCSRLANSGNALSVIDGVGLFGGRTRLKFVGPATPQDYNRVFVSSSNVVCNTILPKYSPIQYIIPQVSLSLLMIEDCTGRGINVTYEFVERKASPRLLMDSNTFSLFTASAAGIIAVLLYANDIFQIVPNVP